jgi:hypothetical protein
LFSTKNKKEMRATILLVDAHLFLRERQGSGGPAA